MGHWSDRGGNLQGSWERFLGHGLWLQFHDTTNLIKRKISPDRSHDRATIVLRSHNDHATIAWRSGLDCMAIGLELHFDRARIAWRSSLDRGASTIDASDAAINDDRATIARRSGQDHASIVVLREKRQPFDEEQVSCPMIW